MPTDPRVAPIVVDTAVRRLRWPGGDEACALGRCGVLPQADKREGDGTTPLGVYPLRCVYYRPDRLPRPVTALPLLALTEQDGWCDDPVHPLYNRSVEHPFAASAERLWREDGLYDVLVVLGHNDDPVVAGLGSAIFLHCATRGPDCGLRPTEGCVAIERHALVRLLATCAPGWTLAIQ